MAVPGAREDRALEEAAAEPAAISLVLVAPVVVVAAEDRRTLKPGYQSTSVARLERRRRQRARSFLVGNERRQPPRYVHVARRLRRRPRRRRGISARPPRRNTCLRLVFAAAFGSSTIYRMGLHSRSSRSATARSQRTCAIESSDNGSHFSSEARGIPKIGGSLRPYPRARSCNDQRRRLANDYCRRHTHRKEYVQWIEDAKKPETRLRRIGQASLSSTNEPSAGGGSSFDSAQDDTVGRTP
jgi:Bacteriocin-protection, YdeI or OmpD-Associated